MVTAFWVWSTMEMWQTSRQWLSTTTVLNQPPYEQNFPAYHIRQSIWVILDELIKNPEFPNHPLSPILETLFVWGSVKDCSATHPFIIFSLFPQIFNTCLLLSYMQNQSAFDILCLSFSISIFVFRKIPLRHMKRKIIAQKISLLTSQ